jgi:uncharacterized protein YdeI (YjbR/CyaY-like superfamily)
MNKSVRAMDKGKRLKAQFFESPAKFRAWLERNHRDASELLVGFYKRDSGRPSITWPESVDEALCFGWIDGIRRRLDDVSYTIRFTPRKARSNWSAVNIARVTELARLGLMAAAGLAAFEKRSDDRSAIYAYEQRHKASLSPAQQRAFRDNAAAWRFFQEQPPWYRRTATYWVISAKKEETRAARLARLIADSGAQRRIGPLTASTQPARTGTRSRRRA